MQNNNNNNELISCSVLKILQQTTNPTNLTEE